MTSRRAALTGADREAFIKAQIMSVHKALNKNEVPLKQKHVRVLIVGTHKEKSSSVFWNTVNRIQLEKNPVLTWKFCHLLHKLIRDGHRRVIDDSLKYRKRIIELGHFWQHLHTSGYGLSNNSYCTLLVSRLEFHKRNPVFPGSLQLPEAQINKLVNADVNHSFELSIEMLDQMDDLLNLQTTVFHAMDVVRWSSMVPQGQCLLAPLILVILDTSKFYDYLVKIIFKLHEQIPPDALSGHRERFGGIFRKMKAFYEEATNLQYFKYLVSVPKLPSLAPNFLQASDLDTYQSPHAYLHNDNVSESDTPPDGRSIDESLVDISEPQEAQVEQQAPSTDPRDLLIDTLRRDVEDARFNNERLMNEARSRIEQYENRLLQMKHENDHYKQSVDEMKEELERVRAANVESERHAVDEARLQDIERKALSSEQNFQKMKSAYANLRQEHIEALTKLSNAQKDLATSESERMNKEEAVRNLERKMVDIEKDKLVVEKKMLSAEGNVDDLQGQLAKCQIDIENLTKTIDDMKEAATNEINSLNAEKQSLQRQVTEMDLAQQQLKEQACATANSVDDLHGKLSEMTTQNALLNQTITDLKEASSKEIDEINAKNKMLQMQIAEMDLERQQLNERACTTANSVDDLQAKLSSMTAQNASLNQTIGTLKETSSKELEESRSKSALLQMQIDELARERMQLKEQACTAANNLNRLQTELSNMTTQNQLLNQAVEAEKQNSTKQLADLQMNATNALKNNQKNLFESCCNGIEHNLLHAKDELHSATSISYPIQLALPSIRARIEQIDELTAKIGDEPDARLVHEMIVFGHELADLIVCSASAAYTVSIQHYEPVHEQCRLVAVEALGVVKTLKESNYAEAKGTFLPALKKCVEKLETLCKQLPTSNGDLDAEKVDALLEDEMKRMDAAIQKAVQMIEEMQKKSRATDSGIRLEVNEKILESCNALMAAIIELVKKSHAMQEEIVANGRGSASPKEFYKRNHEWTEGLISAAKAVGVAATVLVQCADGVITRKGKLESLIVASQEIGASTAQLFVSSRVKAERGSEKLAELSRASHSVNTCTANVVATVKNAQQTLTDKEVLDFSHLSLHETKMQEMESQVRVLELESALEKERVRFSQLRKQHYHLPSLVSTENGSTSFEGESPK